MAPPIGVRGVEIVDTKIDRTAGESDRLIVGAGKIESTTREADHREVGAGLSEDAAWNLSTALAVVGIGRNGRSQ